MKKNIYKDAFTKPEKEEIKKQVDYYSVDTAAVKKVQTEITELKEKLDSIEKSTSKINPIVTVKMPKVQEVKVTNPIEIPETVFPDVQKVEVTNPTEINIEKVDVSGVEKRLDKIIEFKKEKHVVQKVEITNPTTPQTLPLGKGTTDPKTANPDEYLNVRLTDGKKFYKALDEFFVAAAKPVFPFVNKETGKPQPAAVDNNGVVQTNASGTNQNSITTISGNVNLLTALAGEDFANLAFRMEGQYLEVPFTTTTAQAVASQDVSYYKWVSVQVTSQGGSSTITFQGSNDNSNWINVALINAANTGGSGGQTSTTITGIYAGALNFRYFRLNVTGIASGTTAGIVELYTISPVQNLIAALTTPGTSGAVANVTTPTNYQDIIDTAQYNATLPTITNGKWNNKQLDANGRELVSDIHPTLWNVTDTETTAQTDKELKADPGAGLSLYVTDIVVSNGATAGTVLFEVDTGSAKTVVVAKLYLAINGGAVLNFKTPIKCTAHKNFGFTSATVTTHTITVNGFIAP